MFERAVGGSRRPSDKGACCKRKMFQYVCVNDAGHPWEGHVGLARGDPSNGGYAMTPLGVGGDRPKALFLLGGRGVRRTRVLCDTRA